MISGPGVTNNKIDPTQLNPTQQAVFQQMEKMLNLFPLPNASGFANGNFYNYSQSLSGEAPRREDILRVDLQINSKNRLYGRWIHNSETDTSPFTPFPGPFGIFACSSGTTFTGGCIQQHPGWNFSANLVSTITPTILNELSVGPSHTLSLAEGTNGNISRAANGITLPLLYAVPQSEAIPDMSFNGLNAIDFQGPYLGATPWHQANTTINVNDNLTWVWNSHVFKTGMFYQRNRKDQIAWGNFNGQFNFGDSPLTPERARVGRELASSGIRLPARWREVSRVSISPRRVRWGISAITSSSSMCRIHGRQRPGLRLTTACALSGFRRSTMPITRSHCLILRPITRPMP